MTDKQTEKDKNIHESKEDQAKEQCDSVVGDKAEESLEQTQSELGDSADKEEEAVENEEQDLESEDEDMDDDKMSQTDIDRLSQADSEATIVDETLADEHIPTLRLSDAEDEDIGREDHIEDTDKSSKDVSADKDGGIKVPDANGNLERATDTKDAAQALGQQVEARPKPRSPIRMTITPGRGRGRGGFRGKRKRTSTPTRRNTRYKKRGELELLYDVSGPPSKRCRSQKSVFLQEVERKICPKTGEESATTASGEIEQFEDYQPPPEEVEIAEPEETVTVPTTEAERKIQTRGKKNRYWYTYAKQSKADSPLYRAIQESLETARESQRMDVERPCSPDLNNSGDEFQVETPFDAPPEKKSRMSSPVMVVANSESSSSAHTVQKLRITRVNSNSPKCYESFKPKSGTEGLNLQGQELLSSCQPCRVDLIDFIKCLDLFKVPSETTALKTAMSSSSSVKKHSSVKDVVKAKTPDKDVFQFQDAQDETQTSKTPPPIDAKQEDKKTDKQSDEKKEEAQVKDERKVPPLRIKLSSIKKKNSDLAAAVMNSKGSKKFNVKDKADLLSKTFVVDHARASSPSAPVITLVQAEESVRALDMQLKALAGEAFTAGGTSHPKKLGKQHTARKQVHRTTNQKFHCKKCTYTTNVRGTMQEHIYNHTSVVPYSCGHCGAIFGTRSGVMVHTKRDHRGRPYSILKNSEVIEEDYYSETQLDKGGPSGLPGDAPAPEKVLPAKTTSPSHSSDSVGPNYKCVHCAFTTGDLGTIQSHVSLHKDKDRRYVCPLCDLAYCKYADGMVKHFQKWHPNQKVILQYQPDYYDTTKDINLNSAAKSTDSSPKSDSPPHDSAVAANLSPDASGLSSHQNSLKSILDAPAAKLAGPAKPKAGSKMTARKSIKSPPANIILKVPTLDNLQRGQNKNKPAAKLVSTKPHTEKTSKPPATTVIATAPQTVATNLSTKTSSNLTKEIKIGEVRSLASTIASKAPAAKEIPVLSPEHEEHLLCKFCDTTCSSVTDIVSHIDAVHQMEYWYSCPYCTFGCSSNKSNLIKHMKRAHTNQPSDVPLTIIDEEKYFTRKNKPKQKVPKSGVAGVKGDMRVVDIVESEGEDEAIYRIKGGKKVVKHRVQKSDDGSDKASVISEEDSVIVQKTAPTMINVGLPINEEPLDMSIPSKTSAKSESSVTILRQPPPMQPAPKLAQKSMHAHNTPRLQPPPLIPLGVIEGSARSRLHVPPLHRAPVSSSVPTPISIEPPPAHSHPSHPSPKLASVPTTQPLPPPLIKQPSKSTISMAGKVMHPPQKQLSKPDKALKGGKALKASRPPSPDFDDENAIRAFSVFNLSPRLQMRSKQQSSSSARSHGNPNSGSSPSSLAAARRMAPPAPRPQQPPPPLYPHVSHAPVTAVTPPDHSRRAPPSYQSFLLPRHHGPPAPPPLPGTPHALSPMLSSSRSMGPPNVVVRPTGLGFTRPTGGGLDRVFTCPYCPFTAPEQDTLHNHILTHEPNIQWTCPYCLHPNQMAKGFVEKHITHCHPGKRVVYIPFGIRL